MTAALHTLPRHGQGTARLEVAACPACGAEERSAPLVGARYEASDGAERFAFVRCGRCTLVYQCPRVGPDHIPPYYGGQYLPHLGPEAWGRHAPSVARYNRWLDRRRVAIARRAATLGPGLTALDVGCGRGSFVRALVAATGARGIGIDVTDRGWLDAPMAGVLLRRGGLEALTPDDRPSLVTLWHVLEHDYAPRETLARLHEVAAPGAAIVVEVPDYDSVTRRLQGASWAGYDAPRHTVAFTPRTLAAMLEGAGWRVERQQRWGTLGAYILGWVGWSAARRARGGRSLESEYRTFVVGRALLGPVLLLERLVPMGVQLAVARRR